LALRLLTSIYLLFVCVFLFKIDYCDFSDHTFCRSWVSFLKLFCFARCSSLCPIKSFYPPPMADRIDPFQDLRCLCAPPILVINVPNKLYMSCPPGNTNIVSFSPGGEHDRLCIPSSRSSFTPISMHPPPQQSAYPPSQPRFMYPMSY